MNKETIFPNVDTRQLCFRQLQEMNLSPLFQEDFHSTWDVKTSSKYIELICLNFPLPAIYLGVWGDEKKILVGCQSLLSVFNFVNDQFSLSASMDYLADIQGKKYGELKRSWQRRIWDNPSVTVHIIENFDRLDYQSLGVTTILERRGD